jgi:uncharacterized membrane protein
MTKGRLEAFSDGVIAIIITIMVLDLKVPEGSDWEALRPVLPVFATYVMSFIYVAIYWNNHHHMLHLAHRINGAILWANLHLLFWLSLIPFATGWMGRNHFTPLPAAVYGGVLLMAAFAWLLLQTVIIREQGPGGKLREAIGRDVKGKISFALYALAIALAYAVEWAALAIYILVALMWIIPDRRIEAKAKEESTHSSHGG